MAQPTLVLNHDKFDEVRIARGFATRTEFINSSGIPRRTFADVMQAKRELSGPTIAMFLRALPGTSFEYLFSVVEREAA